MIMVIESRFVSVEMLLRTKYKNNTVLFTVDPTEQIYVQCTYLQRQRSLGATYLSDLFDNDPTHRFSVHTTLEK